MLRRFWIWPLLVVIIIVALMPVLNGWVAHRLDVQLINQSGYQIKSHQYNWGYLNSREQLKVKGFGNRDYMVTILNHHWGLGPSMRLKIDHKSLFKSQWRWHLFPFSMRGIHHYLGTNALFSQLKLTTTATPGHVNNQVLLANYQDQVFHIQNFVLKSTSQYALFGDNAHRINQSDYQIKLGMLGYHSPVNQFKLHGLTASSQVTPGTPLATYHNQLQINKVHWSNKGLSYDLENITTQMVMQAYANAISHLGEISTPSANWQKQLGPLLAHGFNIHINPLVLHSGKDSLKMRTSLDIEPTALSFSRLDNALLLQNTSAELHAKVDVGFLDNVAPDSIIYIIEQALRRGIFQQKGKFITANLIYRRGQLQQKPDTGTMN
ncbi:MAG: hypothetical protein CENE_00017 [Candidatus Celerinatantimonas neptuna]|nr:MAG: hypothetical protein CENE_00017 [Candidatus Celerinatantimonas neptuna]